MEGTQLTAKGTVLGTPEYISPEQVRRLTADARSDQYSLAVVAYEMLSGRVPFEAASTLALLHQIVYKPPSPIRQARPDRTTLDRRNRRWQDAAMGGGLNH